mgnify:CR=1 FL=1
MDSIAQLVSKPERIESPGMEYQKQHRDTFDTWKYWPSTSRQQIINKQWNAMRWFFPFSICCFHKFVAPNDPHRSNDLGFEADTVNIFFIYYYFKGILGHRPRFGP